MKWKDNLLNEFFSQLSLSEEGLKVKKHIKENIGVGIHLAIFNEPYYSAILNGSKTVESRFSIKRISPFRKVYLGDIILMKKTAEPITCFFIAGEVDYWRKRNAIDLELIEQKYSETVCSNLDPHFWKSRKETKYATFIKIQDICILEKKITTTKNDRQAWAVLKEGIKLSIFDNFLE